MTTSKNPILDSLSEHLDPDGAEWMSLTVQNLHRNYTRVEFLMAFSSVPRFVGKGKYDVSDSVSQWAESCCQDICFDTWSIDDACRIGLLLQMIQSQSDEEIQQAFDECLRYSDGREQACLMKSLPVLPHPERYLQHALETCRSNSMIVFEALVCENPYPQQNFTVDEMNQMVIKAMFLGVSLRRIQGLDDTANTDRARIALDFKEEREAASRPVPYDLWRLIGTDNAERSFQSLQKYHDSEDARHRYAVALALGMGASEQTKSLLKSWLPQEMEESVATVIQDVLNGHIDWSKVDAIT